MACSLDRFFNPASIAIFGASTNPRKVGHTILDNLIEGGFDGSIIALNPKYETVGQTPCFPTLQAANQSGIDLAVICTPAATVPSIIRQCGECGVGGVLILTAGFQEAGAEGTRLQNEVRAIKDEFPNMRIIGPNCVGIVSPHSLLNASFGRGMPAAGRVTFISQSGALCTSVLDWALKEQIGFANFISVGNMMDVGLGELIDKFADDPQTDSLVLYIESIKDAPRFTEAACRFASVKPIIAYKAGRFKQSAAAAASHTGALAGEDAVYDTVFRRIGIERVFSIEEMFDAAEVLSRGLEPSGDRLAIVSNAGGPAVMATDALIELGGTLANFTEITHEKLNQILPANWSHQNPVDVIGDATPERLKIATQTVLTDENVDAVLVVVTPQAMTDPTACADTMIEIATQTNKPILASWMGGLSMTEATERLNTAGIPTFETPERAVTAFQHLVKYQQTKHRLAANPAPSSETEPHETESEQHLNNDFDQPNSRETAKGIQAHLLPLSSISVRPGISESHQRLTGLVTEINAKQLLGQYGIDVVSTQLAKTADEAIEIANEFGYPVVVKIASPEISHKSDIGGVKLNLNDEHQVATAFHEVIAAAHQKAPQEIVMGVSVQPMVSIRDGYELIAGSKRDPMFGPVIMIGAGGIFAEIYKDVAFELPPLNERLATSMLHTLKSWKILKGFRGNPPLNIKKVADVLVRLSTLCVDHPEIAEFDINPLLVTPQKAVALDARIILRQTNTMESQENQDAVECK
ncbi:MAG: acetyltransferase [Mariniblastus sp.]|jgi:acetyltransferase